MNEELREAINEEKICETRNDPEWIWNTLKL